MGLRGRVCSRRAATLHTQAFVRHVAEVALDTVAGWGFAGNTPLRACAALPGTCAAGLFGRHQVVTRGGAGLPTLMELGNEKLVGPAGRALEAGVLALEAPGITAPASASGIWMRDGIRVEVTCRAVHRASPIPPKDQLPGAQLAPDIDLGAFVLGWLNIVDAAIAAGRTRHACLRRLALVLSRQTGWQTLARLGVELPPEGIPRGLRAGKAE